MSKQKILKFKVIKEKRLIGLNKNIESQTLQIYKSKGHRITENEIKQLTQSINKKIKDKTEFSILGVNGDAYRMLKSFKQNDVRVQTYDEYNQSVNFESENFIEFYQLQVTFHKHIS